MMNQRFSNQEAETGRTSNLKTISPRYADEDQEPIYQDAYVQRAPEQLQQVTSLVNTEEDRDSVQQPPSGRAFQAQLQDEGARHGQSATSFQSQPPSQLGLTRQTSYQRMLERYNEKKDKMAARQMPQTASRPNTLPQAPSGGRLNSQRGSTPTAAQERQPQYLAFLEKTLEKSDLTIQSVKQMDVRFKGLEQKVDNLQNLSFAHDEFYNKLKYLEEMQLSQHEENNLNKLMIEMMQTKIRDQDLANETLFQQLNTIKNEKSRAGVMMPEFDQQFQDNQVMLQQAINGLDARIEDTITAKMADHTFGGVAMDNQSWARREQKIMELVDNQGKDIAVDIANIEQTILQIQTKVLGQGAAPVSGGGQVENSTAQFDYSVIELKIQEMINEGMEQFKRDITNKVSSPNRQPMYPQADDVKYLRNKIDQFENHLSHLTVQMKQVKFEKLNQSQRSFSMSRSRSRSRVERVVEKKQKKAVGAKEIKDVEARMTAQWTTQLTDVVDKLGTLIKKQEKRIYKVQKAIKEINKREGEYISFGDNRAKVASTPGQKEQQKPQQMPMPQTQTYQHYKQQQEQRITRQNTTQRKEKLATIQSSNYKTFSPILSSTSRSVRNLMDRIQEQSFVAPKSMNVTQLTQKSNKSNERSLSRNRSLSKQKSRKFSPNMITDTPQANIRIENTTLSNKHEVRYRSLSNEEMKEKTKEMKGNAAITSKTTPTMQKKQTKEKIVNGRLLSTNSSNQVSQQFNSQSRLNKQQQQTSKTVLKAKTPVFKQKKSKKSKERKSISREPNQMEASAASIISSKSKKLREKSYERQTQSSMLKGIMKNNYTESSELVLNDFNFKPIRGLRESDDYQYDKRQERGTSAKRSRGSRSNGKLSESQLLQDRKAERSQSASPYRKARQEMDEIPSPEVARIPTSNSSPYIRSTQQKERARSNLSRSPDNYASCLSSKLHMPRYIGNHLTSHDRRNDRSVNSGSQLSNSLSRSRARKQQNISNQKDGQVLRDDKGIKRKIEYIDDSESEEDDLAYSKSIMQSRAMKQSSKASLQNVSSFNKGLRQGTPKFEDLPRLKQSTQTPLSVTDLHPMQGASKGQTEQSLEASSGYNTKKVESNLQSSPNMLQQSSGSTNLDRSMQVRATNDRLAKLEAMYEELSNLEAKAAGGTEASQIR